jgi:hypothetical protein
MALWSLPSFCEHLKINLPRVVAPTNGSAARWLSEMTGDTIMRRRWALIASFCVLSGSSLAPQVPVAVDLELVIAVDVSYSMDSEEQRVQREGYVNAFRSPEVVRAVLGGPRGKTAVTFVEWGGSAGQVVPWTTLIDGAESAAQFAEELRRQPIRRISFTSISNALALARELIRTNQFRASRHVIDVSGDGPNNAGAPVPVARNAAIADGITVDGLPTKLKTGPDSAAIHNLDAYYEACVIGGDGAFLVKVSDVSQFAEAIRNKLVVEIAGFKLSVVQERRPVVASVQHPQPYNCVIGEESEERAIGK